MPTIHLVRHGKASAGWAEDPDPGLDATGQAQAAAVAERLAPLGPLPVITSPLARARETAAPLCARWGVTARVEPRIAEVPSPDPDLAARAAWLRQAMAGTWADQGPELVAWRDGVVQALLDLPDDAVLFSHFVAINAAVAVARDDPRMTCCRSDNAAVAVFSTDGGTLQLLEAPAEAVTRVN